MPRLLQNFRNHITDIALRFESLGFFQNRSDLLMDQQAFLEAVLNGTIPDSRLPDVLCKLTEILHTLHQKQVVILIDEYDTPTSYAVQNGHFPEVCQLTSGCILTHSLRRQMNFSA